MMKIWFYLFNSPNCKEASFNKIKNVLYKWASSLVSSYTVIVIMYCIQTNPRG